MRLDPDRYRLLCLLDTEPNKAVEAIRSEFVSKVGEPVQEPNMGCPILAALHKARLKAGRTFQLRQRNASRDWLSTNGYEVPH